MNVINIAQNFDKKYKKIIANKKFGYVAICIYIF